MHALLRVPVSARRASLAVMPTHDVHRMEQYLPVTLDVHGAGPTQPVAQGALCVPCKHCFNVRPWHLKPPLTFSATPNSCEWLTSAAHSPSCPPLVVCVANASYCAPGQVPTTPGDRLYQARHRRGGGCPGCGLPRGLQRGRWLCSGDSCTRQ